jgi:hypothetical protein
VSPFGVREYITFKKNPVLGKYDGKEVYVKYKSTGKFKKAWGVDALNRQIPIVSEKDKKGTTVKALYTYNYPITIDPSTSPIPSSDSMVLKTVAPGPTTSYGKDEQIYLQAQYSVLNECGAITYYTRRSYLRWDLSSLSTYTIDAATLHLNFSSNSGVTIRQSSAEIDPETGDAGTVFTSAGGTSLGTMTGTGDQTLSITSYASTHNGGYCDIGVTLTAETTVGLATFHSSEASNASYRPCIYIEYSEGGTNATVTQVSASASISGGTQAVAANVVASASVTQVSASLSISGGTQAVESIASVNASITQVAANLVISVGTQVIEAVEVISAAVAQVFNSLSLSTGTAVVAAVVITSASVSQVSVAVELSGGTQEATSVQSASITQVSEEAIITGGVQSIEGLVIHSAGIEQVAAEVSITGGTQAVAYAHPVTYPDLIIVDEDEAIHLGGGYYERI